MSFTCFNTQPPEGGCVWFTACGAFNCTFQHTATRRWLQATPKAGFCPIRVSTHSHPKVAAPYQTPFLSPGWFQHTATRRWLRGSPFICAYYNSFNTQPPEGGCVPGLSIGNVVYGVSTHSHPKVAAFVYIGNKRRVYVSTHSHPKVAASSRAVARRALSFQHTATRRWLQRASI